MEVSQNTNLKMIDESIKFFGINIAILTISDTRNFDNDKSGSTLRKLVEDCGHTCISRDIIKDEPKQLLSIFNKWTKFLLFVHLLNTDKSSLGSSLTCLLYTSPSPRDLAQSRMPSSA